MVRFKAFFCRLCCGFMVLMLLVGGNLAQAQDIQMLPPVAQGSVNPPYTPCPQDSGNPSMLAWDGKNPINCVTGFYADPSGNLFTGGALQVGVITSSTNGWGTGNLTAIGEITAELWDGKYRAIDPVTGSAYDLIGFYHGWQTESPNTIYIGGYNAGDTNGISAVQSIIFGGYGTGANANTGGNPTGFVDLVGHKVGINTINPQGNLDIENGNNTATLCLNGRCKTNLPAELTVPIAQLNNYHTGCTDPHSDYIDCAAACSRFCNNGCLNPSPNSGCNGTPNSGNNYTSGILVEWDGGAGVAACSCF